MELCSFLLQTPLPLLLLPLHPSTTVEKRTTLKLMNRDDSSKKSRELLRKLKRHASPLSGRQTSKG